MRIFSCDEIFSTFFINVARMGRVHMVVFLLNSSTTMREEGEKKGICFSCLGFHFDFGVNEFLGTFAEMYSTKKCKLCIYGTIVIKYFDVLPKGIKLLRSFCLNQIQNCVGKTFNYLLKMKCILARERICKQINNQSFFLCLADLHTLMSVITLQYLAKSLQSILEG